MTAKERIEAINAIVEFMKLNPAMHEDDFKACGAKVMELIEML